MSRYTELGMRLLDIFKKKPKIIAVVGQTATGKSNLAVEIALQYNGEIISCDSRQVYTGLDIGSAKITTQEMRGIPHHMIDVVSPTEYFSVQEFKIQAEKIMKDILQRKKIPILCGGTGLYIDALIFNHDFPNVPPNQKLRAELQNKTSLELYQKLSLADKKRAESIDPHNKVRVIRALEIIDTLGTVPKQPTARRYTPLFIGLQLDKEELHNNIKQRILTRLETNEMIHEVQNLYTQGISYKRLEDFGLEYKYIAYYLQEKISYDLMIQTLTHETQKFAKRQKTWFKRNKNIRWFHPQKDYQKIMMCIRDFLK